MKKIILFAFLVLGVSLSTFAATSPHISIEQKTNLLGATLLGGGALALRRKNIDSIEQEAMAHLSNFDGEENYEGFNNEDYDGFDDDMLDFDGVGRSFANEASAGRVFTFTVTNTLTTAAYFYLVGGYKNKIADTDSIVNTGTMTDGSFKGVDGAGALLATAALTGTSTSVASLNQFRRFYEANPIHVTAFKLDVTDAAIIAGMTIDIEELSPFQGSQYRAPLRPTLFINENTFRNTTVTVPMDIDLNDQVVIRVLFPATAVLGQTVTFSLVCGGILNSATALKTKRTKAARTIGKNRR